MHVCAFAVRRTTTGARPPDLPTRPAPPPAAKTGTSFRRAFGLRIKQHFSTRLTISFIIPALGAGIKTLFLRALVFPARDSNHRTPPQAETPVRVVSAGWHANMELWRGTSKFQ